GEDRDPPRTLPGRTRRRRQLRSEGHARRFRAVHLSRPRVRIPDAPQRDRPCERDLRRRSGAGVPRAAEGAGVSTSLFGAASPSLAPGARNAVEVCLSITPADRVALVADEASAEVAASLAGALTEAGATWEGVLIERVSARPMRAAPEEVIA